MKVLDVSHVKSGIDDTKSDIDSFYDQINPIQRAVRTFYGLEESLSGKNGEAMRSFFNEVHQPFLTFLHQSMFEYQNVLSKMKEETVSFESNSNGFIKQSFLDQEVTDGFDNVEKKALELTEEANGVIKDVNDLVTISNIDTSEIEEKVGEGKKETSKISKDLEGLDQSVSSLLEQTKKDLSEMKTYLSNMEEKLTNGDVSIANFDVESIKGMESFQSIHNGAYGEGNTKSGVFQENSFDSMPINEIEKQKDVYMGGLDSDSQEYLNKMFASMKNGEIGRENFRSIMASLIKNEKPDLSENISAEEANIGWEGEIGGYETHAVWSINLQLNKLKIDRQYAEQSGNVQVEQEAKEAESELREKYAHLSEYLIDEESNAHVLPESSLAFDDGSEFEYRIDGEGKLYYKAEPGYEYYEETFTQTGGQRLQGVLAKTAVSAVTGRGIAGKLPAWVGSVGGGGSAVLEEYATDNRLDFLYIPQTGETKTMIYRTDKETGETENLVIDTYGHEILEHSQWSKYK